ncbi:MAG: cytochrome B, partial [Polyangiales bacterium]
MNREAVCGRSKRCWYVCVLPALMGHGGCAGAQSALDPAGSGAARISVLFWQMTVGSAVIWLAVVGLALYATYKKSPPERTRHGHWLIVGGGVIAPTVVLAGLLIYGLAMLPPLLAAAPPGSLRVQVSGEQYWWRVRYPGPNGETVELANELRLPVGEATQLELTSPDVIHSFWIPSLGGKVDMIPGRTTQLALHPTRTAELSGACAEFCGTSHAHMGFKAVVLE